MVPKICYTFAPTFEKQRYSYVIKKEFFERFYINRQVVQEAVWVHLIIYGAVTNWVKETNRQEIDIQVYTTSINEKDIRPKHRQDKPSRKAR